MAGRVIGCCVISIDFILLLLGLIVAGLAGSTLKWANPGTTSLRSYQLRASPSMNNTTTNTPRSILELPTGFRSAGIRLVFIVGILAMLLALLSTVFTIAASTRKVKSGQASRTTRITRGALKWVLILTILIAIFSVVTLAVSWDEYKKTPSINFATAVLQNSRYTSTDQTPESWARQLALNILGNGEQSEINARYVIAGIPRVAVAPIIALEVLVLFGLLIIRESLHLAEDERDAAKAAAMRAAQKEREMEMENGRNIATTSRVQTRVVTESTGLVVDNGFGDAATTYLETPIEPHAQRAKRSEDRAWDQGVPSVWVQTPTGGSGQAAHTRQ